MDIMEAFAARLKALRDEHKLSQDELGKAIGISRGSISFYEKQSRTPDIVVLGKLSKYFNVTMDYLLGYSDSRTHEGVITENEIGLSEQSIETIKRYKTEYPTNVIKVFNQLLQQEDTIALCELINEYNNSFHLVTQAQQIITHYLNSIDFLEHSKTRLKEYLATWEMSIDDNELDEIDDFIKRYIDLSNECEIYTDGTIQLASYNKLNDELFNDMQELFNDLLDRLCKDPKEVTPWQQ
ncbi:MAG TPA: helix-turn-helix domain-containing protein [Candidatus Ornithomonoglobus merdipullorum]|uniref:Helix-turn-helix domain-containing protein n=1 Tax=Candidatus Ornithomonoglobus merdipullorum TaxID=2840895 RepID=A0A9D1SFI1_9FIRM|nr:helix-turn-helix domain-containing protein [Candidatus Ornithomonoglobus merdipullorum]